MIRIECYGLYRRPSGIFRMVEEVIRKRGLREDTIFTFLGGRSPDGIMEKWPERCGGEEKAPPRVLIYDTDSERLSSLGEEICRLGVYVETVHLQSCFEPKK